MCTSYLCMYTSIYYCMQSSRGVYHPFIYVWHISTYECVLIYVWSLGVTSYACICVCMYVCVYGHMYRAMYRCVYVRTRAASYRGWVFIESTQAVTANPYFWSLMCVCVCMCVQTCLCAMCARCVCVCVCVRTRVFEHACVHGVRVHVGGLGSCTWANAT